MIRVSRKVVQVLAVLAIASVVLGGVGLAAGLDEQVIDVLLSQGMVMALLAIAAAIPAEGE